MELREARIARIHNYLFIAKKLQLRPPSIFDVDLYHVLESNVVRFSVGSQARAMRVISKIRCSSMPLASQSLLVYFIRSSEGSRASRLSRSSTSLEMFHSLERGAHSGRSIIRDVTRTGKGNTLFLGNTRGIGITRSMSNCSLLRRSAKPQIPFRIIDRGKRTLESPTDLDIA